MKCLIIYFSLTENTKKIAFAIHRGITALIGACDISALKQTDPNALDEYDLIGMGSPVWASVPPNVEKFINSMPLLHNKRCFVFSTHGAKPERFFPRAVELLTERGLAVIGTRDWYGSVYLPNLPKPYLTDGHPDEIDLKEAEDFGIEIVELSMNIINGNAFPPSPPSPLPPEAYRSTRPRIKIALNRQRCIYPECRLCMDYCPMNAIDLSLSPPVFGKGCEHCYFCEMICPQGAIETDYDSILEKGISRARDVFIKALEIAEAEGRFRPLVSEGDVGWDTPYYKRYSKRPRYVIPERD